MLVISDAFSREYLLLCIFFYAIYINVDEKLHVSLQKKPNRSLFQLGSDKYIDIF